MTMNPDQAMAFVVLSAALVSVSYGRDIAEALKANWRVAVPTLVSCFLLGAIVGMVAERAVIR